MTTRMENPIVKSITVDKEELIRKLTENRAQHITAYDEAVTGWRTRVTEALQGAAEAFIASDELGNDMNFGYRFQRPTSHVDEYDRALQMLQWETQGQVQLSLEDFSHLIQDDWDWSSSFRLSSSQYSAS